MTLFEELSWSPLHTQENVENFRQISHFYVELIEALRHYSYEKKICNYEQKK